MLREAALLQLDLMLSALDDGLILKDASPYNVQWRGARPVFVDVGSFERLREGEPWAGYRQFCSLYLNPLLLQAYRGIPFQGLLRGSIRRNLAGRGRPLLLGPRPPAPGDPDPRPPPLPARGAKRRASGW